jgi:hypothetical protein
MNLLRRLLPKRQPPPPVPATATTPTRYYIRDSAGHWLRITREMYGLHILYMENYPAALVGGVAVMKVEG